MTFETVSVRWTGKVTPLYTGTYTFLTRSDDGVRLYVNGQKIIDNWNRHPETLNSGNITLTAGQQADVKMEFFQSYGGATARPPRRSASSRSIESSRASCSVTAFSKTVA